MDWMDGLVLRMHGFVYLHRLSDAVQRQVIIEWFRKGCAVHQHPLQCKTVLMSHPPRTAQGPCSHPPPPLMLCFKVCLERTELCAKKGGAVKAKADPADVQLYDHEKARLRATCYVDCTGGVPWRFGTHSQFHNKRPASSTHIIVLCSAVPYPDTD